MPEYSKLEYTQRVGVSKMQYRCQRSALSKLALRRVEAKAHG